MHKMLPVAVLSLAVLAGNACLVTAAMPAAGQNSEAGEDVNTPSSPTRLKAVVDQARNLTPSGLDLTGELNVPPCGA